MTPDKAVELVKSCGSIRAAALKAGMPRTTFRDLLDRAGPTVQDSLNGSREARMAAAAEVAKANAELTAYRREHGKLEILLEQVLAATPQAKVQPHNYIQRPSKKSRVDACLHLTDIHFGAVQDPDEVEGFGEYSPAIAEKRLMGLTEDLLNWVDVHRNGYAIDRLHVLVTGDLVSGDIHDELRITNAFPAPVQAVECGALLTRMIGTLAPEFSEVVVHSVSDDNHGRLTRKPQAKEAGINNWSYITGRWMQKAIEHVPNVNVNLITRPWDSVECNGRRYLLTHGHHVSGWAGFPYYGIERLVSREAIKRLNGPDVRKFHKVVMGHWHAPLEHPYFFIGGSVSGTDAYDHGQGRHAEPQQVSWLIHPRHGEFDRTCWQLRRSR